MRALHAVVLAVAAVTSAPVAGHAEPSSLTTCGFVSIADPTGDAQTGEVDSGPVVLGGTAWGSVTCTIQTGLNRRHADADAASATSPVTPGVALLAPTPISYPLADGDSVYFCTRVDVTGGATYYWESSEWYWPNNGESGRWSTDPDARCDPPPISTDSP
jgi:hypothetical protein